jgi:outer membrane biosynthesis protein TonB
MQERTNARMQRRGRHGAIASLRWRIAAFRHAGLAFLHFCIPAFLHSAILVFLSVCIPALLLSGCVRAHAKTEPEPPPLDAPAPPPRNVEARTPEAPPPVTLVEPVPTVLAPPTPAPSAQQRSDPTKPEPPKVEPAAPVEAAKPVEDPRGQPATTLQTTPAEREAQVAKGTRDVLARALADLNRIDYSRLKADARAQYDQAKRFISQAEDALQKRNFVFASNLADKALTLAAQLPGR